MSDFTGEEDVLEAILKLKNSIEDFINEEEIYSHDFYLLRWLLAWNMDVKKAEKYLRATAVWRREYDVPSLLEANYPEGVLESLPFYIDAVTSDGILVCSIQAGFIDFRGLLEKFGRKEVVRYMMQMYAQSESVLVDVNKKTSEGKALTRDSVQGIIGIVDMDQFDARQVRTIEGIQTLIEVCRKFVKHFPFLCTRHIFINCNSVASIIMKIVRPILEGPNLKIEAYGSNREEWHGVISSLIPTHLLRECFGGTRSKEKSVRTQFIDRDSLLSM